MLIVKLKFTYKIKNVIVVYNDIYNLQLYQRSFKHKYVKSISKL